MSRYSVEEIERLDEMAGQRLTAREIGLALGRTKNSVLSRARKSDISLAKSAYEISFMSKRNGRKGGKMRARNLRLRRAGLAL